MPNFFSRMETFNIVKARKFCNKILFVSNRVKKPNHNYKESNINSITL
jgi:hypothetical protein